MRRRSSVHYDGAFVHMIFTYLQAILTSYITYQENDKNHEKHIVKEKVQSAASLLCEIPFQKGPKSFEQDLKYPIPDQKSPWVAIHGTKSAIITNKRTQVETVDVFDPEETRNKDQKMIHMTPKVLAIAFSACKAFVAIADAEKLFENNKDISSEVLKNIRSERASVDRLRENALSCVLVHRFQSEQYVIIGNHATFISVWETVVGSRKDRPGINQLSMCDSRLAPVDAMAFDGNYRLLVLLSKGKLS
ncbi:unnamed protein product [Peronospora destructor]|uniref:Uncharacterized protein n=1 Tax=Peronospora destructor TaxID=86335 RepID=A0AAV0U1L9_9STRA|nr:unnamed protein product [Peronospora destructor]